MAISEVVSEIKSGQKEGHSGGTYVYGIYMEYTPPPPPWGHGVSPVQTYYILVSDLFYYEWMYIYTDLS